jgi:hypothetical protein
MIGAWLARHQPEWLERLRIGAPLYVGPTGAIALAADSEWIPGAVFVQIITKIDESNTHGDAPFMVMAAHTARLGQWNRFDDKWRKALTKSGLGYFHAVEHHETRFSREVGPRITDNNLLFGMVVRLSEADYRAHYREGGGWTNKAQPMSMYGLCFAYILGFVYRKILAQTPQDDFTLNFIIEEGHPNAGAPAEILKELRRRGSGELAARLGHVTQGDKKRIPGLQAADALAFGGLHVETRLDQQAFDPSVSTPERAMGFVRGPTKMPVYGCNVTPEELQSYKHDFFVHIELTKAHQQIKQVRQRAAWQAAKKASEEQSS